MERFKYIFENAMVGIAICNAETNALEAVNPAFAHIHGYEPEELIGVSPGEVFAPECMRRLAEHESEASSCPIEDISFETTHIRKDGSSVPVSVHITVVRDETGTIKHRISNVQDISDKRCEEEKARIDEQRLKEAQEKARRGDERMRLFFERQLVGMAITSPEKGWVQTNEKLRQMLGYTHEELTRLTWAELTHPNDLAADVEQFARVLKGEINDYRLEKRFICKDGSTIYVNLAVTCTRNDDGSVEHVLALLEDISEQKNREEALRRTQNQLATLVAAIPDMVWIKDENGVYLGCNKLFEKFFGASEGEIIGKTDYDFVDKEQADFFRQKDMEAMAAGTVCTNEEEIVYRDSGAVGFIETRKFPVYHPDGRLLGVMGIGRDITERKAAEETMHMLTKSLNAASESVFIMDIDTAEFFYVNDAAAKTLEYSKEELIGGMNVFDIDPDTEPSYWRQHTQEIVGKGVVNVESRHRSKSGRIYHIDIMAQRFEHSGKNYHLAVTRDITERKQIDERLQKSESLFRSIVENLPGFAFILRLFPDGMERFSYFSGGVGEFFGKEPHELVGDISVFQSTIHKDDMQGFKAAVMESAYSMEPFCVEYRAIHPSKGEMWLESIATPEAQTDGSVVWHGITINITERKLYRLHSELISAAVDSADEAFYIGKLDEQNVLRYTFASSAASEMLGYSKEEFIGKSPLDFDPNVTAEMVEQIVAQGQCVFEATHRRKDGRFIPVEVSVNVFAQGEERFAINVVRDISERKRQELLKHEREQEFRVLVENAPNPIFRYDKDGRRTYVNPFLLRFIGRNAQEILGGTTLEKPIMSAKESEKVYDTIRYVLSSGDSTDNEMELVSRYGDTHTFHSFYTPELDKNGNIIGVLLSAHDITGRKLHEAILEKHMEIEKRQSQFFAVAPGFFYTLLKYGDDYSMPFVSSGVTELFGLDPQAVMDDMSVFVATTHPDDLEMVFRKTEESAQNMTPYNVEYRSIHPTKGARWIECKSLPSHTRDGGIRWDGIKIDITERKRAEQELKDALELISGVINAIPDLLFEMDIDGNYLNVWTHDEELLAAQKEVLLNSSIHKVLSAEAAKICMDAIREADKNGLSLGHTFSIDLPQGKRWFELSVSKKRGSSHYVDSFIVLSSDITKRKQREELLVAKEREFRTLVENLPDNILRYDRECRHIYVTPLMDKLFGEGAVEFVLGKTMTEAHGDDAQIRTYQDKIERVLATGEADETELVLPVPSGKIQLHHIRFAPERLSNGEICGVLAIGRDITDKRETEKTLEMFGHALNHSTESVFVIDSETAQFVYVNDTAAKTLGYSKEELTGGMGVLDIGPGVTMEFWAELFQDLRTKGAMNFEAIHRSKSGRVYPVDVDASYFEYGGREYSLSFTRDITERKALEDALDASMREIVSQKNFQDAMLGVLSDIGLRLVVIENGKYIYTNGTALINEYGLDEISARTINFFDVIHPSDKERIIEIHRRRALGEDAPKSYELSLVRRDGQRREHEVSVAVIPNTTPTQTVVVAKDITKRKKQERQIAILTRSLDRIDESVYLLREDASFQYVNETACRTLGYTEDELLGGMGVPNIDPDYQAQRWASHLEELKSVESMIFDTVHTAKDGRLVPVEVNSSYINHEGESYILATTKTNKDRCRSWIN